jgi:ribosomal protein S18 acetylase RimI-like enzyme
MIPMKEVTYSIIKTPEEINILRGIESHGYTMNEELIKLLQRNFELEKSLYLLVKSNSDFAGFCSIDKDWWEDNYFFLREIIVDPQFQQQGIGKELMTRCISHAKKSGANGVVTETDFDNARMQKLCEKLGFKKWDNPQWKDGITYKLIF